MVAQIVFGDVRSSLSGVPGLDLPETLTDAEITATLARKQATVLKRLGLEVYPTDDNTGNLINNAVLGLALIDVQRRIRPDSERLMTALVAQEKLIMADLSPLENTGEGHVFFDTVDDSRWS